MSELKFKQLPIAKEKFQKTFHLLQASVEKTADYDATKVYTADELEPYDALSDRFILKKSVEYIPANLFQHKIDNQF